MRGTRGACIIALLMAMLSYTALAWPSRVSAEMPESSAATFIAPHYCDDRETLAGLVNAESGAQPYRVQVAVAQVFVKYAERNQSTICWMSRFTGFSSVPAYVRRNPNSYQASRYKYPPPELLALAGKVLRHELEDETGGATNFDGSADGQHIDFSN